MNRSILSLALLWTAPAAAGEFRTITLSNGRTVPAEILEMTATEMVLRTAQGELHIAPSDLRSMDPLSPDDFAQTEPWSVLVLPFKAVQAADEDEDAELARMLSLRVLQSIPAVRPITVADLPPTVTDETRSALAGCGTDLGCVIQHGAAVGADVVVMGHIEATLDAKLLNLGAVFVKAPDARHRKSIRYQDPLISQRSAITTAQYEVLFLAPPADAPLPSALDLTVSVPAITPDITKIKTAPPLDTLAWVPVPGITALRADNKAGFATALGVVGVGTAATVALTGHATYSATQMAGMSALTSYGLTVLVNHIFLAK
jgi:hypothetical protein